MASAKDFEIVRDLLNDGKNFLKEVEEFASGLAADIKKPSLITFAKDSHKEGVLDDLKYIEKWSDEFEDQFFEYRSTIGT